MKINVKEPILDYEGKQIPNPDEKTPLTIFDVFINSLNGRNPDEGPLTAELKSKIYQISKKIYESNEPNFTPDQLIVIKERVGKTYAAMVYGRILELIDGEIAPTPAEKKESTSN